MLSRSKTDQESTGQIVGVVATVNETCPVAALRGVEGAGLDGGDRGRSTVKGAVRHLTCIAFSTGAKPSIGSSITPRIHIRLTDVTER